MTEKLNPAIGYIGNALRSVAEDHITSFAEDCFDESRQKYQSEINTEHDESLQQIQKEQTDVNAELNKKFNKENIAQESGDSEELVMSQKAVSDKLSDLANYSYIFERVFTEKPYTSSDFSVSVDNDSGTISITIPDINNKIFGETYKFNQGNIQNLPNTITIISRGILLVFLQLDKLSEGFKYKPINHLFELNSTILPLFLIYGTTIIKNYLIDPIKEINSVSKALKDDIVNLLSFKIDKDSILQELGYDENKIISQKAITNKFEENINEFNTKIYGKQVLKYNDTFTNDGYFIYNGSLNNTNLARYAIQELKAGDICNIHTFANRTMTLVEIKDNNYILIEPLSDSENFKYVDKTYHAQRDITIGICTWKPNVNVDYYYIVEHSLKKGDSIDEKIETLRREIQKKEPIIIDAYATEGDNTSSTFYGNNAIQDAINSTLPDKEYIIRVHGVFSAKKLSDFATLDTSNPKITYHSFISLLNHPNITLRGDGCDSTLIIGDLTEETSSYTLGEYQTIQAEADNIHIEDMTIIGHKVRYAIHIDKSNSNFMANTHQYFKGCRIIVSKGFGHVIGVGLANGQIIECENCEFIGGVDGEYYHDGGGGYNGDKLYSPNMIFKSCYFATAFDYKDLMVVQIQGGISSRICEFYNCTFNCGENRISLQDSRGTRNANYNFVEYNKGIIRGSGNSPAKFYSVNDGVRMLKLVSQDENAIVTFDINSSCFLTAIKGLNIQNKELIDGTIYENGYMRRVGWAMGLKGISQILNNKNSYTFGSVLGDCSNSTKSLGVTIGETSLEITFNKDYTNMTDDEILSDLNTQIGSLGTFTYSNHIKENYQNFSDACVLCKNVTGSFIPKGTVVRKYGANSIAPAKGKPIYGITIQSIESEKYGKVLIKGILGLSKNEIFGIQMDSVVEGQRYTTDSNNKIISDDNGKLLGLPNNNIMIEL